MVLSAYLALKSLMPLKPNNAKDSLFWYLKRFSVAFAIPMPFNGIPVGSKSEMSFTTKFCPSALKEVFV
jgi:hypothetical protein